MSEETIEKEIQDKGLTAPRLTPALIDAAIKDKDFHVFENSCLTVCCLTLQNGFTVTGESACASPENFDAEIGEKIAFENARNKIWALEGYLLKEKLYRQPATAKDRVQVEFIELSGRLSSLNTFIETDAFNELSGESKELLLSQSKLMMDYVDVLCKRIEKL